ncbi:uncharacterized protein [Phaenicophaeus curvirostris]|uniref:uncharacterized protein isoform X2 n=1 Tax=Phaenicophaeus curvirostris TaxID=33595 RepID=UPI0037F0BF49
MVLMVLPTIHSAPSKPHFLAFSYVPAALPPPWSSSPVLLPIFSPFPHQPHAQGTISLRAPPQITPRASVAATAWRRTRWTKQPWVLTARARRRSTTLRKSAAGFKEMAAPTSSYEKTRPVEAGASSGPGSLRSRFENMAKLAEEESRRQAEEERVRHQARGSQPARWKDLRTPAHGLRCWHVACRRGQRCPAGRLALDRQHPEPLASRHGARLRREPHRHTVGPHGRPLLHRDHEHRDVACGGRCHQSDPTGPRGSSTEHKAARCS